MQVALVVEETPTEKRVPIVPDSVKRLAAKNIHVALVANAGVKAGYLDSDYTALGATVAASPAALLKDADVVIRLRIPSEKDIAELKEGSVLVSPLLPLVNHRLVKALAAKNISAISVDSIPRTTLAQMMDVLSSQATVAGYYAVLLAASALPKFFPMLITAAGTIAPAKVLVLGAGVAGLQAIGMAKRLGAVVEAFDVRKAVKEQVESLGAKFVDVPTKEDAQTAGGYAKELSDEDKKRQSEILATHISKADVVITTALIPGKRAPVLVTEEMVKSMRPGSVIVDLAAEQDGNCALTEKGKTVIKHGVTLVGELDLPSHVAMHASQMYSRNMEKLLFHLTDKGAWKWDLNDEITRGCLITHQGKIVHEAVRTAVEG